MVCNLGTFERNGRVLTGLILTFPIIWSVVSWDLGNEISPGWDGRIERRDNMCIVCVIIIVAGQ